MKFYAELNGENICTGVKIARETLNDSNVVEIESMDADYVWKQYDPETKTWSAEKFLPDRPAIQLKEFEQLKADKEALEAEMKSANTFNAMILKDLGYSKNEVKSVKALMSDVLLKMARNGIN